jgi:hypothetical protein
MTTENENNAPDPKGGGAGGSGGGSDEPGKPGAGQPPGDDNEGNRLKRRNDELAGNWKTEKERSKTEKDRADAAEKELAAIKGKETAATDKLNIEQGKWQEVLAARDKKIEDLLADIAKRKTTIGERDSTIVGLVDGNRERTIIDRLAEAEGVTASRSKIEDAVHGVARRHGLDLHPPDDALDKAIAKADKILRTEYKELFGKPKPGTTGGSPPSQGQAASKDDPWKQVR